MTLKFFKVNKPTMLASFPYAPQECALWSSYPQGKPALPLYAARTTILQSVEVPSLRKIKKLQESAGEFGFHI